jgi:hypothetical protein
VPSGLGSLGLEVLDLEVVYIRLPFALVQEEADVAISLLCPGGTPRETQYPKMVSDTRHFKRCAG